MRKTITSKERGFSVELKSKRDLKNVTLTNGSSEFVLVEGSLGELLQATFKEGVILEVVGKNGVLRVELEEKEVTRPPQQLTAGGENHD